MHHHAIRQRMEQLQGAHFPLSAWKRTPLQLPTLPKVCRSTGASSDLDQMGLWACFASLWYTALGIILAKEWHIKLHINLTVPKRQGKSYEHPLRQQILLCLEEIPSREVCILRPAASMSWITFFGFSVWWWWATFHVLHSHGIFLLVTLLENRCYCLILGSVD